MAENNPVIDSEESAKNLAKHILNAEKSSRDFVENFKDALSFTKQLNNAMERVYDNIAKNGEKIGKNNELLAKNGKGMESNLAKQATLEASINQYKKERNELSSDLWIAEEKKLDLSKQLLAIESEMEDAQMRAIHNEEDLSEEYSKMMQVREKLMQDQIKNSALAASLTRKMQINEKNTNEKIKERNELGNRYNELAQRKNKLESNNSGLESANNLLKSQVLLIKLIQLGYDRFIELDKAAEDFRKQTGFSNTQMVELRKNAESINVEFQDMGVGITEVYTSAKALTDVFGRTSLVSREAMQNVSLMSVNLGVAAEDSANVLATFQGLGGATQEVAMNVMKVGAGFSEKAGIPFSLVMKDIANASEQTTALLGANPSKLMKSAIAARALGTDLNKIVSSQRKLLDFSSSINEELEASALLGRSISFQKARQLAYDGDIEGAAKATLDSVKAAGDFNAMNVYQREALAKASGMELKDLTKMMAVDAQRQEIELRGTDEQKAKLKMQTEALAKLKEENDLSKEGLLAEGERAIRQQKMQGLMTKMKNLLESVAVAASDILEPLITPMVGLVIPGLKIIAGLAKLILWPFKAFAGLIGELGKGIKTMGDYFGWTEPVSEGIKSISKFLSELFTKSKDDALSLMNIVAGVAGGGILAMMFFGKGGLGAVTKGISSSFGMLKGGLSKIPGLGGLGGGASAVGKVGDIAKSAKGGGFGESLGKGIASFMKYVAKGIGYFGSTNVLKGALGIALVGASIIPFAFAMQMFSGIDWKSVGIGSLALLGFTAAAFGLGALLSTGVGAAIFGAGVIGIAALGAALIPFAAAALMAGAGIKMLGEGISSSVDPILRLSQIDLTKTALGIGAVGIALAAFGAGSAAAGLGSFVGGLLAGDPIKKMERLGAVGEKLKMTAEAISEISNVMSTFTVVDSFAKSIDTLADSLSNLNDQVEKIGVLKLAAITAISAAGAATAAAPAAATNLNTGGIEAKLDTLTNLLTGGAVRVYLDGKDVSAAMTGIGR